MTLRLQKDRRHARNVHIARKAAPQTAKARHFSLPSPAFLKGTSVIVLLAAVGAGLLVGLALGSLQLYRHAVSSPFFAVKNINVIGNIRLERDAVVETAGVRVGDNCLAVSIAGMEQNISRNPWVEEAAVKRILPDRFDIRIKEREPWFWVRHEGTLHYSDERGRPIAPVEFSNFASLPALEVVNGAEELLSELKRFVTDIKAGARTAVDYPSVSRIRLSPGKGVEMHMEDRDIALSVAPDDWNANLARLATALGDLARRGELARTREVRAADGNVWVVRKL
jgi:cell division protein FtsQ